MNFLLSLNKKIFLLFSILILLLIFFLLSFIYFQSESISNNKLEINKDTADITKPKFAINSEKQKISVTANQGNFIKISIGRRIGEVNCLKSILVRIYLSPPKRSPLI